MDIWRYFSSHTDCNEVMGLSSDRLYTESKFYLQLIFSNTGPQLHKMYLKSFKFILKKFPNDVTTRENSLE